MILFTSTMTSVSIAKSTSNAIFEAVSSEAATSCEVNVSRFRKSVGSAAVGCALCMGTVVPLALSSTSAHAGTPSAVETQHTVDELAAAGVFRPTEPDDGTGQDWLSGTIGPHAGDLLIVVTPGTDDGTLYPRIRDFRTGDRPTYIIDYPEAIGPFIAGRSGAALPFLAPTYDKSRDVAVAKNMTAMRAFATQQGENPFVVYTGYSQGAEALGNAAEQAVAGGGDGTAVDAERSHIMLISDPRSPWGLKAWAADHPAIGGLMGLFGAESNGARDPGATGELPVTSVIVVGDPVANFQWVWYRPMSSLLVDAAGFITIHSGLGEQNYGNLIDYSQEPSILRSRDGNTTYLVYTPKQHPLTALAVLVNSRLGIPFDADDVERWDEVNNAFYPLQAPGVDNAAVGVVEPQATEPTPSTPPLTAQSRAIPEKVADTTSQPASPANASNTTSQVPEQHADGVDASTPTPSTGRHRAPEAAPDTAPAPSTTTTASDPETPQPPAETAPPVQESSPDQSESDDASTGGRHRVTGQGRHAADSGDAGSHAEGSGDAMGTAPAGTATTAAA